jgi:type I restriction enzyme R subunit
MSNFAFLQSEWSIFYGAAIKAEEMANTDARASCFYARRTLELAVHNWIPCSRPSNTAPSVENFE